jgi:hypothetical protein
VEARQREELRVELQFYGLLDRIMPYDKQECIAKSLLTRACLAGTWDALHTAVAQSRALVFEMGSTTDFLSEEFQGLRWVITDRVVNESPVWATAAGAGGVGYIMELDGKKFMYRDVDGGMSICVGESNCYDDIEVRNIFNPEMTARVVSPTQLPSDAWLSDLVATLEPEYSATVEEDSDWVRVPCMRITAVHGLDDDDPTMAAALRRPTMAAALRRLAVLTSGCVELEKRTAAQYPYDE